MLLTHLKRITKNSFGFFIGTILTQAIGFFLLPIYSRYLTPADYGIISISQVIASIILIFCVFGMRGAISRYYYDYYHDKTILCDYLSTICITVFTVSFIIILLLSFLGENLFSVLTPDIPFYPYLILVFLTTFLSIPLNFALNLIQTRERSIVYSLITLLNFLLTCSCILLFIVILREGALGSLKGQLIATFVFCIIGLVLLKKDIGLHFNLQKLRESLAYGLPTIPHELAGWTMNLIDRIFLNSYTSLATVGLYSLAYQFGSILSFVIMAINNAWVPFLFSTVNEKGIEESAPILARLTSFYMMVLMLMGLIIALFSKNLIILMTTPKFYDAYHIVPYIVLVFVFNGMYFMVVNQLFYLKKTRLIMFSTLTAAILNIGLNIFLIPRYEMVGAAVATVISYAYSFILVFYFSYKYFPIQYDYKRIVKTCILALCLFLIALILPQLDMVFDIFIKCLLIGGYFVGIIIFGIINPVELAMCKGIINNKIRERFEN